VIAASWRLVSACTWAVGQHSICRSITPGTANSMHSFPVLHYDSHVMLAAAVVRMHLGASDILDEHVTQALTLYRSCSTCSSSTSSFVILL
jgi:hypothetical protein